MDMSKLLKSVLLGSSLFAFTHIASAAGFQTFEQSAASMGTANAGTAVTDDASAAFYNPAAMSQITNATLSASGILIIPTIDFEPALATNPNGDPILGNSDSPRRVKFVPAFYYVQPINDRFTFGLSVAPTFGLETTYDYQSLARYFATESYIETFNINPNLAFKITDKFSVGAGIAVERIRVKLAQAFNAGLFLPVPTSQDIFLMNQAANWAAGWNAGLFYQLTPDTKAGLAYRSAIKHNLTGSLNVDGVDSPAIQAIANFFGLVDGSDIDATVTLPETATFSLSHNFTHKWAVMGDIEYIHWNRVQTVNLNVVNSIRSFSTPIIFNYHDTWRAALGTSYKYNEKWLLRAGTAFDQSPVRDEFRTARIPDSNRIWLTMGANYKFNKNINVDVSYAHIFLNNVAIAQQDMNFPAEVLFANYQGQANLIGAQINYVFN